MGVIRSARGRRWVRRASTGVVAQEFVAAFGHHDRIENDVAGPVGRQAVGHRFNDVGGVEHADFDGVGADVGQDRVDLGGDEVRRYRMNGGDGLCVLGGQGRDYGHAVAFQGGKGFQVGLNAGPAAAVRAGDGQGPRMGVHGVPFLASMAA